METEINELRAQSLPRGVVTATSSIVGRARNAIIIDTKGREFIDFAGGIGIMNVGHAHPRSWPPPSEQLDLFAHTVHQRVRLRVLHQAGRQTQSRRPW